MAVLNVNIYILTVDIGSCIVRDMPLDLLSRFSTRFSDAPSSKTLNSYETSSRTAGWTMPLSLFWPKQEWLFSPYKSYLHKVRLFNSLKCHFDSALWLLYASSLDKQVSFPLWDCAHIYWPHWWSVVSQVLSWRKTACYWMQRWANYYLEFCCEYSFVGLYNFTLHANPQVYESK